MNNSTTISIAPSNQTINTFVDIPIIIPEPAPTPDEAVPPIPMTNTLHSQAKSLAFVLYRKHYITSRPRQVGHVENSVQVCVFCCHARGRSLVGWSLLLSDAVLSMINESYAMTFRRLNTNSIFLSKKWFSTDAPLDFDKPNKHLFE